MDSKTTTFYEAAKQAILYDDMDALSAAKAAEVATGRALEGIDRDIFNASFVVAEMKTVDGKAGGPFEHKNRIALQAALAFLGFQVRYDVRAAKKQICIYGEWRDVEDLGESDIRAKIGELFSYRTDRGPRPLHYGGELWTLYLSAILHNNRVDPFREWFESLPEWDGIPRIDSYLTDIFTVDPSQLALWAAQFLVLGPIQRAYDPGAKLDEMPVLVGDQDIGKSTLLRCLLPSAHRAAWFADGLHLADDPKSRAEALLGRVIVEASEMAGSNRAELESLKAFITRQDDGAVRLSYRRNPETMLRRCIIVGTTNRRDSLPNDPSGNRRFVPVDLPTSTGPVEPYMETNSVQLWAEGLNRYRGGVRAGLPRDLKRTAEGAAETHRNRDELLEDRVEALSIVDGSRLVEIAEKVGLVSDVKDGVKLHMREAKRLAAALRNAGWTEYRDSQRAGRGRRWRRNVDTYPHVSR